MNDVRLQPVIMPVRPPERMVQAFSRFDLGDLEKWGPFLLRRLGEKYPFIRETEHASWVRSLILMPDTFFIKTAQAIGCAQIMRDIFRPAGWVQERFVFTRSKASAGQMDLIYQEIWRWAINVGVHEFVVDKLTDATRDQIQEALKTRILKREEFYLKL
jgi:hypothetical protein